MEHLYFKSSISEKEFFASLSDQEVLEYSNNLQEERRRYLKMYLECLEQEIQSSDSGTQHLLLNEKMVIWEKHLHFQNLEKWCLEERNRRNGAYTLIPR